MSPQQQRKKEKDPGLSVVLLVLAAVVAVVGFVNAAAGPTCGSQAMGFAIGSWPRGGRDPAAPVPAPR